MKLLTRVALFLATVATAALGQSPNTAALVVLVVDPAGTLVEGARVAARNTANGLIREALSTAGQASIRALQLTDYGFQSRLPRRSHQKRVRSGHQARSEEAEEAGRKQKRAEAEKRSGEAEREAGKRGEAGGSGTA